MYVSIVADIVVVWFVLVMEIVENFFMLFVVISKRNSTVIQLLTQ